VINTLTPVALLNLDLLSVHILTNISSWVTAQLPTTLPPACFLRHPMKTYMASCQANAKLLVQLGSQQGVN